VPSIYVLVAKTHKRIEEEPASETPLAHEFEPAPV
jgi:hypothetical protein